MCLMWMKGLTKSHLISAGGAIKSSPCCNEKEVDKAFALIRPPGHHAQRVVYVTPAFSIINIEAIMLENIRTRNGPMRTAIVDTDCHHGRHPRYLLERQKHPFYFLSPRWQNPLSRNRLFR